MQEMPELNPHLPCMSIYSPVERNHPRTGPFSTLFLLTLSHVANLIRPQAFSFLLKSHSKLPSSFPLSSSSSSYLRKNLPASFPLSLFHLEVKNQPQWWLIPMNTESYIKKSMSPGLGGSHMPRAAGPVSHSCWACASGACAPQQERPR